MTAYLPLPIMTRLNNWGVRGYEPPDGIIREAVKAHGVNCEWIQPSDFEGDQTLMYLHGGGFIFGLTTFHLDMVSYLAKTMNIRILMVDYRLAPYNEFPASLDDCVTAYLWLLESTSSNNIVIAGDSAGGNLTLTTLMKLRDDDNPLPAAAACLSPVADLTKREQMKTDDLVLHPRAAKKFNKAYVADKDPTNPLISPIFGDWSDLPPILVHAGDEEMLKEDAIRIKEKADEVNTKVDLHIFPEMWHVWQIYLNLPQAIESLDEIATYLSNHLNN